MVLTETNAGFLLLAASRVSITEIFDFLLKIFGNLIDARMQPDGYSVLIPTLYYDYVNPHANEDLNMILIRGADPHLIGFQEEFSPQKETPTSVTMYNSWAFVAWRKALLRISTDLELFVQKELQQSPLKTAGWHENSLLFLFHSHIHPRLSYHCSCNMCGKPDEPFVELPWRRWLDSIKEV